MEVYRKQQARERERRDSGDASGETEFVQANQQKAKRHKKHEHIIFEAREKMKLEFVHVHTFLAFL